MSATAEAPAGELGEVPPLDLLDELAAADPPDRRGAAWVSH